MSEMHNHLRKHHHLRHYGRLQYGQFLKGIGVKIKDALQFFRSEFSKISGKKLDEYMYYIEHLYGLKGKKTEYSPWGCEKLANGHAPGSGDTHGCPFAYYGENALKDVLRKKFPEYEVSEIIKARKDGKHIGACKKMFFLSNPTAPVKEGVGRHPNSYFDGSMRNIEFNMLKEQPNGATNLGNNKSVKSNDIQPQMALSNLTAK